MMLSKYFIYILNILLIWKYICFIRLFIYFFFGSKVMLRTSLRRIRHRERKKKLQVFKIFSKYFLKNILIFFQFFYRNKNSKNNSQRKERKILSKNNSQWKERKILWICRKPCLFTECIYWLWCIRPKFSKVTWFRRGPSLQSCAQISYMWRSLTSVFDECIGL